MTVVFIKGDDEALVAQEVVRQTDLLVGDGDKSLMLEELTQANYFDEEGRLEMVQLVNAALTPPFLTDRRVVVARHLALFSKKADVAPLIAILDDLQNVGLVLVWEKASSSSRLSAVPKALKDALANLGANVIDAAPKGKARKALVEEQLAMADVQLDRQTKNKIADAIGDDVGQLNTLLETLYATFGTAHVKASDVEPFLGQASDVPPWELTDAIDSGDIGLSLEKLHRMLRGGSRHSLQIMATLHNHYQKALALQGSSARNDKEAAAIIGGSPFPARKALNVSKKLGIAKLSQVFALLAEADLGIRGKTAIDPDAIIEVLVARLARLSR